MMYMKTGQTMNTTFELREIVTKDKLVHQGIYYRPTKPRKIAILWVHGLSGTFYGDIPLHETFARECEEKGWGYAAFHNRGHDLIAGVRKLDGTPPKGYSYFLAGAGQEVFEESVLDLDAAISFLADQGFLRVILVGHSTGANKVCYYVATQKDPRVVGAVLAGPMSDRLDTSLDPKKLKRDMAKMKQMVVQGKGDALQLGYHYFPMTPKRFLSLFGTRSTEDTFDYGDTDPRMAHFSRMRLPLLVVLAENDEYADRPMQKIRDVFDAKATSKRYKSVMIPRALHKFNGKEKEFVSTVVGWAAVLE